MTAAAQLALDASPFDWTVCLTDAARATALAGCTFAPASAPKRFVRQMRDQVARGEKPLTPKQRAYLRVLAHQYRRQLGRCMAEDCEKCRV